MKMMEISTSVICITAGIDTSKAKLDVAVHGRTEHWQVDNKLPGWRRLASELAKISVTRIGIEATGGYENGVVRYLREQGFTVLVLQPMQVRAFARVHLRRAKNDKLDAVLIAACAAAIDAPQSKPDARLAELAGHLTFVEQIEEDIARLKVRLEHVDDVRLRRLVLADIAAAESTPRGRTRAPC
jgi:transposase